MPVNGNLPDARFGSMGSEDGTDALALVLVLSLTGIVRGIVATGHGVEGHTDSHRGRHATHQVQKIRKELLDRTPAGFRLWGSGKVDDLPKWIGLVCHDWTPLALVDMASLILGPRSTR